MRSWHFLLVAFYFFCLNLAASEVIRVGGYAFSPFVTKQLTGYRGYTIDLIEALNRLQDQYHFEFTPTAPGSRHNAFEHRRFDMIFFENMAWGWQLQAVDFIPFNIKDGDVMVAMAKPGRGNDYFNQLNDKTLIAVKNYHYGFTSMERLRDELQLKYQVVQVKDNEHSLQALLRQRGDIAFVTHSYLQEQLRQLPELKSRLLVSSHYDNHYQLGIILRRDQKLNAHLLQKWVHQLEKQHFFEKITPVTTQEIR